MIIILGKCSDSLTVRPAFILYGKTVVDVASYPMTKCLIKMIVLVNEDVGARNNNGCSTGDDSTTVISSSRVLCH